MAHYIYVLDMLGYGTIRRAKVGITKNVSRRIAAIGHSYGGLLPELVASFVVPSERAARLVETAVIRRFDADPHFTTKREIFRADASVITAYIRTSFPVGEVM